MSFISKVKYVLSLITIEPMVLVQGIAQFIILVPQDQMILYKVCREAKHNVTQDFCSNIEDHVNTTSYDDIEKEAISFNSIISWTEHFVPILLAFYIGSWSDRLGRRPFLALCMLGRLVGAGFNLLNAVYLDEWNKWVWLGTVMPVQNISGGFLTFIMMTYSFIADISTQRERMIRISIVSFCWQFARPISYPIGSWLYGAGGYVCVFGASLLLYIIAALLGLYKLWNFPEQKKGKGDSVASLLSPRHIADSVKTVFMKRPDNKRFYLLSMMFVMLSHLFGEYAEAYCQFLYTKRLFSWEKFTTSGGILLFSLVFHYFNLNDNIIILMSGLSGIAAQVFRALAKTESQFIGSIGVEIGGSLFSAPIRAQMTRCVLSEETGKVFAMLACLESLVPILTSLIFTNVYNATSGAGYPWKGTFYFGSAAFTLMGLMSALSVYIKLEGKMIKPYTNTDNKVERI